MKRKISCALIFVVFLLSLSGNSWGGTLSVGDIITFGDGVGSGPGGAFNVYKNGAYLFDTFCLEKNEYMYYANRAEFKIDGIDAYANLGGIGGGSPDYLSDATQWLYYNFSMGTLDQVTGFKYNDTASADALQQAIWYLEGEGGNPNYLSNATASAQYFPEIESVMVLNIVWGANTLGFEPGTPAQSMLHNTARVPEPTSMLLFGIGLVGLAGYGKRKFKKS